MLAIRSLVIMLVGLFAAAVFGVSILIFSLPESGLTEVESKIAVEAAKSLFQLIVIVLIGGTVTAVFKALETSVNTAREKENKLHEEAIFRSEVRADYLKRVGTSYRTAKAVRRALRAAGLTNRYKRPPIDLSADLIATYKAKMETLNEAQLELEALKIEAGSLPGLVGLQELPHLLSSMENYLGKVVKEYQKINPILTADANSVNFQMLEKLEEFTGPAGSGDINGFEERFATPHDEVIKLIADRTKVSIKPS